MNRIFVLGAMVLGLAVITTGQAEASDYLKLSLLHERSEDATFVDRQCSPGAGLAAYFGCIDGNDGRPIGARGDFGNSTGLQLAWGRHLGELWRGELVLGYHPGFKFRGNANFLDSGASQPVTGSVRQWQGGARAWLNLAAAAGFTDTRVTPWLGVGAGIVRNRVSTMTYRFPAFSNQPALTTVPGSSTTGMTFNAALGMDLALSNRNVLELGLSWNDYGNVRTAEDDIEVIRGGNLLAEVAVGQTRADLESWGLQIGLRHYFRR
jgi:opacity protein-like surface antigen